MKAKTWTSKDGKFRVVGRGAREDGKVVVRSYDIQQKRHHIWCPQLRGASAYEVLEITGLDLREKIVVEEINPQQAG
jgi:hypothetical protein